MCATHCAQSASAHCLCALAGTLPRCSPAVRRAMAQLVLSLWLKGSLIVSSRLSRTLLPERLQRRGVRHTRASLYSRAHDGTAFSVCVCSPCAKPPERTPMNTESLRETLSPLLALFWFDSIRQVSFLRSHCSRPHFTAFLISFILFIAADRTLLFSRTSLDQRSSPFLIQIRFHPNSLFVRIPLFAHHPKLGPLPTATPKPQVDRTVCCS